ncbi:MAG: UDP-N-acetylglucosamine--N-acetylmuramyl-(pentapeptide) pyrophosphoryl-undecaprenol N-acetylglucosamine transferase [Enterobacteriaceae bacterium]
MKKKIIIVSGGTAGHIYPAIDIALYMLKKSWEVLIITSKNRIEKRLFKEYNLEIEYLSILFSKIKIIRYIYSLLNVILLSLRIKSIFKCWKPDVILGMGSYVSFPILLLGKIFRIPITLHEQNKIVGKANYYLSKITCKNFQAYSNTIKNGITVGNPIRKNILKIKPLYKRILKRKGLLRLLIVGGSQGSKILNKIVPKVAKKLKNKFIFWHQTGLSSKNCVIKKYLLNKVKVKKVEEFIRNIFISYTWADIIICRAGAITVSELVSVKLPAIFIPFIHSDNHQYLNIYDLLERNCVFVIKEKNLTVRKLYKLLYKLDRKKIFKMSKKFEIKKNRSLKLIEKELKLIVRNVS